MDQPKSLGGKERMQKLTPAGRQKLATQAARARWQPPYEPIDLSGNARHKHYVRMWPREALLRPNKKTRRYTGRLSLLDHPGVYVLYGEDESVYYIGTGDNVGERLRAHAKPYSRYASWKYFCAFLIEDPELRDLIESVLISAVPTARNGARRMKPHRLPEGLYRAVRLIPS